MTPEGKVKHFVRKELRKAGLFVLPLNMQGIGRTGIPDDLVLIEGRALFVEYKAHMDRRLLVSALRTLPTQLQLAAMDDIREHGGLTCVIDSTNAGEFVSAVLSLPAHPDLETILGTLRPYLWLLTADFMQEYADRIREARHD